MIDARPEAPTVEPHDYPRPKPASLGVPRVSSKISFDILQTSILLRFFELEMTSLLVYVFDLPRFFELAMGLSV